MNTFCYNLTNLSGNRLVLRWVLFFIQVVLPRMKKVLAYDKSGITKELKTPRPSDTPLQEGNYQGGGFFKYYDLEQYEEALANCKYEDGDLFDWWMFSKIDPTLDEVAIPYYNPKENNISNFKPDFIFWAQRENRYLILFVDPKGTEHADGYRKIDGYSRIFETGEPKKSKNFSYNGLTINTKLLLKPMRGIADVPENYRKYWFDNFDDFADKIS